MNAEEAREIYKQNKYKKQWLYPFISIIKERASDWYSSAEFTILDMGIDDTSSLEEMGYYVVMPKDPSRTATINITR